MMLPSRLGCPLSLKTPNMGNPGLTVSSSHSAPLINYNSVQLTGSTSLPAITADTRNGDFLNAINPIESARCRFNPG